METKTNVKFNIKKSHFIKLLIIEYLKSHENKKV